MLTDIAISQSAPIRHIKDIAAVVNVIVILGTIISHCPEISDIEINPLVVYEQGNGVRAVDIRIILAKNEER